MYTVCVETTTEFLRCSQKQGNDFSVPREKFDFPGLTAGDRWCVSLIYWIAVLTADVDPKIFPRSTHVIDTEICASDDKIHHPIIRDESYCSDL